MTRPISGSSRRDAVTGRFSQHVIPRATSRLTAQVALALEEEHVVTSVLHGEVQDVRQFLERRRIPLLLHPPRDPVQHARLCRGEPKRRVCIGWVLWSDQLPIFLSRIILSPFFLPVSSYLSRKPETLHRFDFFRFRPHGPGRSEGPFFGQVSGELFVLRHDGTKRQPGTETVPSCRPIMPRSRVAPSKTTSRCAMAGTAGHGSRVKTGRTHVTSVPLFGC